MWGIDHVEGKDRPRALGQQEFDHMGSTVGLLLWMLAPIFHKGYVVNHRVEEEGCFCKHPDQETMILAQVYPWQ